MYFSSPTILPFPPSLSHAGGSAADSPSVSYDDDTTYTNPERGMNSRNTWRQIPHGEVVGDGTSETTTAAVNCLWPSDWC